MTPLFGHTFQARPGQSLMDLALEDVRQSYRRYGAIWFSGFTPSMEHFKSFTNALSAGFMEYVGGAMSRSPINGDQTVVSVTNAGDNFGVPLHGELYYRNDPPRLLWFYCDVPAEKGGETTVCDAFLLCERLSDHGRDFLKAHRIVYIRTYTSDEMEAIYHTRDFEKVRAMCEARGIECESKLNGLVLTRYTTSALVPDSSGTRLAFINNILPVIGLEMAGKTNSLVRLENGYGLPHDVVLEIRRVSEELTFPVPMRSGDLLMVDNTRMMHGRRAFTGRRAVYSRLCGPIFEM
jgi:alpha-ketoglutarate-dependent taurine dioxygenase